jgi:hypothetical protein
VLEQKLAVIFEEFGIDKTGDVLDSSQAGEIFENIFISAFMNPETIENSVDHTVNKIREEVREVRENSVLYGISDELDIQVAERLRSHPLPHWVERMTVGYLNSHGGQASRKRSWWELTWPDGQVLQKCVFTSLEAERHNDVTLLNLENSQIRGISLNLPQIASGQPLPCVTINGLPPNLSGFWGLFEVRLQAGLQKHSQVIRISLVRRRYLSVFVTDEGKVFLPTARHIWDAMQTAEIKVLHSFGHDDSLAAYERLLDAAEQAGREPFDSMQQEHRSSITREEERGLRVFGSRRRAIERVGLPEVRHYRQAHCDAEEKEWRNELEMAKQIVPEIRPLLLMKIVSGGVHE